MAIELKITPKAVAAFRDKDSKIASYRELYEKMPFIEAYAKHTDMRMAIEPKGAIGREDEWETHGALQLVFLQKLGLCPVHRLLDIGCGPGRAARRIVPYLNQSCYTGVDISQECIIYARQLASIEGWDKKDPALMWGFEQLDSDRHQPFNFAWAHSVFTHLPPEEIDAMVRRLTRLLAPSGVFLFTYKQAIEPQRSGLKQFQYPLGFFDSIARRYGGRAEALPHIWPAHQLTGKITGLTYSTL